jgi:hypothetical protein
VRASEEKSDDARNSCYEELQQGFYHIPKYHMEILKGDFIENWGERIFSTRQLGMRMYITRVTIMVLE